MDKIRPAYAQYTDDSLLVSLNKPTPTSKKQTHKRQNRRGLKSIEQQIMKAYENYKKNKMNLKQCKILSVEAFTKKHLKGITLHNRNKNAKKEEPNAVLLPESLPIESKPEETPAETTPEVETPTTPETEEVTQSVETTTTEENKPATSTIVDTLSSMNPFASSEKPKTEGGKKSRGKKSQNKKSRKNRRKQK